MEPKIYSPSLPCPRCGVLKALGPFSLVLYFSNIEMVCSHCDAPFDPREICFSNFETGSQLFQGTGAALIGAQTLLADISCDPEEHKEIIFSDYGVPEGARILFSNITPHGEGCCFPRVYVGQTPSMASFQEKLWIYGDTAKGTRMLPAEANLMVVFVPHSSEENALINLSKATHAFMNSNFDDMLLSSAAAIEDTAKKTVSLFQKKYDLSAQNHSNHVMFNALLPLIADRESAPRLSGNLLASLSSLRKWRNIQAHEGVLSDEVDSTSAAKVLCDSMLVVRYLLLLGAGKFGAEYKSEEPLKI